MKYIDKILEIFFTERDRGIRYPDDYNRELAQQSNVIANGANSQLLMANPLFQQVVAEMYLNLDAQLDMIDDLDPLAEEQIRWVRLQRRALRQVCAVLDNKIAAMENLQNSMKEENENG